MIARKLEKQLKALAKQYPVVTLVGPRQSGKSTLCSMAFPELPIVNLEQPDVRSRVAADPKAFISSYENGVIIDEIQYLPELTSYIQVAADSRKRNGEFILTGSHQFQLMHAVSQSLAGRTAILRLLPLSAAEILNSQYDKGSLNDQLFKGGYPRIVSEGLNPTQALSFYVQTYIERDVRQIINVKDLTLFERFLKLCAARSSQLLNATNLGVETGVNQSTIREWLSVLETSFVIRRVQPHHNNLSKRITKSPKIYFLDTGLLCYLLGITSPQQLEFHPLRGEIIETFVASELTKAIYNAGRDEALYFFRDSAGHEVDFLIDQGASVLPIEVKSSSTFHADFLKGLKFYTALKGSRVTSPTVVYTGSENFKVADTQIVSIKHVSELIT
jgi:predicted AAA+ superfamily ATPase